MTNIRLAILDDHQAIIDGLCFRISKATDVTIVGTYLFGEELEKGLENQSVDVLILDIHVPASPSNLNPYPILHVIPNLLDKYPDLKILVISMHFQRTLVRNILEAGASGYILKDDRSAMLDLPAIIRVIHNGSTVYSPQIAELLKYRRENGESLLTPRQLEVLSYCAAYPEMTTLEISQKINISHSTVRNLLSGAYIRLEVPNRSAAILKAQQLGLIPPV